MRQRYFALLRRNTASYQRHIGNRVVRRTEWPLADQRTMLGQFTRYTMDLGCFQCLLQTEWWQDSRQPFREHGFACTWRTDQYRIVSARGSDFHGAFDI